MATRRTVLTPEEAAKAAAGEPTAPADADAPAAAGKGGES